MMSFFKWLGYRQKCRQLIHQLRVQDKQDTDIQRRLWHHHEMTIRNVYDGARLDFKRKDRTITQLRHKLQRQSAKQKPLMMRKTQNEYIIFAGIRCPSIDNKDRKPELMLIDNKNGKPYEPINVNTVYALQQCLFTRQEIKYYFSILKANDSKDAVKTFRDTSSIGALVKIAYKGQLGQVKKNIMTLYDAIEKHLIQPGKLPLKVHPLVGPHEW